MAERRMFAKTIIDSDAFLDMPLSTQALYFHLSMRADDDGFINNPKKIQRMVGASDDDLKLLIVKNFIIPFESGIVVIKHWRIHNYIQKDRYKATVYKDEYEMLEVKENNAYTISESIPQIEETDYRKKAYEDSSLPYSFEYKIRHAFVGKNCPICGCRMDYSNNLTKPTIQHNIPLSKGGTHELGNISVICFSCNSSIKDNETEELNAQEVIEEWDKLTCTQLVSKLDTQDRLGKDRLDKIREDKISIDNISVKNASKDDAFDEEFETLWKKYPKKQGKKDAFRHYKAARKEGVDYQTISNGLDNYLEYIKRENRKPQFIQQGSTWFCGRHWEDEYQTEQKVESIQERIFRL